MNNEIRIDFDENNQINIYGTVKKIVYRCFRNTCLLYNLNANTLESNVLNYYMRLSENRFEDIINYVILYCLLIKFELSPNARQTISSFCKTYVNPKYKNDFKYLLQNEQIEKKKKKNIYDIEISDSDMGRMQRNVHLLMDNYALNLMPTLKLKKLCDIGIKKSCKLVVIKKETRKRKISPKRKFDFIDLATADDGGYKYEKLKLYKLFYAYKNKLELTSEKYKSLNALSEAYTDFSEFINDIINAKNEREFVAMSLAFWKLEYTYRFVFVAKVAQYMKTNKKNIADDLPFGLEMFVKAFPNPLGKQTISTLITEYNTIIPDIFENNITSSEFFKHLFIKSIISASAVWCFKAYSDDFNRDITPEEITWAADFLKNKFHIKEVLKEYRLDELKNTDVSNDELSVYEYIKHLYLNSGLVDVQKWEKLSKRVKSIAKIRNKRNKNNSTKKQND